MHVQFNSDHNIPGTESLGNHVRSVVESALGHLVSRVHRVEVHVSDENGRKTGPLDKRCMMEARLDGHPPMAVTHHAATVSEAVDGAADKLRHAVDNMLSRVAHQHHL